MEENPETGKMEWVGYCVDLAKTLAEMMEFDYEFSKPKIGRYGKKDPQGKWDGLVGDLARGVSAKENCNRVVNLPINLFLLFRKPTS